MDLTWKMYGLDRRRIGAILKQKNILWAGQSDPNTIVVDGLRSPTSVGYDSIQDKSSPIGSSLDFPLSMRESVMIFNAQTKGLCLPDADASEHP